MTGGKSCGLATAAEWIARQLTEAFGWEQAPKYLIRDRDRAYGEVFARRVRSMGIRDRPTAPRSPWQNGHAERLIGSIRREGLDHVAGGAAQSSGDSSAARLVTVGIVCSETGSRERLAHGRDRRQA